MGKQGLLERITGIRPGTTERQKGARNLLIAVKSLDDYYIGQLRADQSTELRAILDPLQARLVLEACPKEVRSYTHSEEYPLITASREQGTEDWTKQTAVTWATNAYLMDNQGLPLPDNFPVFPELG